ncbi:hypothetical protein ACH5RR_021097 [Cinchona calisaya]|uniref:Retrotransposon gag domain-containing protein n=1 Tax=Cinchona calisaya TaxID=153742 RepID=A0ABD2ZLB1_9GENT
MGGLRRQVQQLQQQLEHLQAANYVKTHHGLEVGNEKEINPFNGNESDSSTGRASSCLGQRNHRESYDVKVDIIDFEGQIHLEDFIDWLASAKLVFNYKSILENKKVKIVAIKLKKYASIWWENLTRQRDHEEKWQIVT